MDFSRCYCGNLHPYLWDALDAEILLDGRLVAAEHGGPVESTTDRNTPETMPHRRTRIHIEEFHPAGLRVLLPNARSSARPGQSVAQDEEQRAHQNGGLEGIGHYHGFHTTLSGI